MKQLICIMCPKGCHLTVDEKNAYAVKGNNCEKGEEYGKTELTNPTRVITSTVKINSESARRLPVKTNGAVPKYMMNAIMTLLDDVELETPIKVGDVILSDIFKTKIDIVSSKTISK